MSMATAAASSSADLVGSPAVPKPPSPRAGAAAPAGASNNSSRSLQQRKRKRLNAVLDKISNHVNGNYATTASSSSSGQASTLSNSENNNEVAEVEKIDNMFGRTEQSKSSLSTEESTGSRVVLGAGPMAAAASSRTGQKNNAALRRELWRDNPQQSVNEDNVKTFRFDSQDRERYFSGDSMLSAVGSIGNVNNVLLAVNHEEQEQDAIFSPGRSPHSSMSSPQVSVDSPRICFSPLRIKDSIEEEENNDNEDPSKSIPKLSVRGCESPLPHHPSSSSLHQHHIIQQPHSNLLLEPRVATSISGLSRPISPNPSLSPTTPVSPSASSTTPLHALRHLPAYLTEVYRRRCLSDTDLSSSWDDLKQKQHAVPHAPIQNPNSQPMQMPRMLLQPYHHRRQQVPMLPVSSKGGSLESEASSTTQESPLDLSVRSSSTKSNSSLQIATSMESIRSSSLLSNKGRSRSSGTSRASSSEHGTRDRLSLDRLDVVDAAAAASSSTGTSVVNNAGTNGDQVAYVCPICGQMFSLHDRLAKHMASRHKSRSTDSGTKAYNCDVCRRSFARSDMLTRHMRLHTGIKPYTCRVCGQVFSRSDHLSTHQRTHTGEKPYRCPSCPYAACRRDMITRHMRTHTRYELQESTSIEEGPITDEVADSPHPGSLGSTAGPSRSISSESADPPIPTLPPLKPKPPSPMDTQTEETDKSMEGTANPSDQ